MASLVGGDGVVCQEETATFRGLNNKWTVKENITAAAAAAAASFPLLAHVESTHSRNRWKILPESVTSPLHTNSKTLHGCHSCCQS